MDDGGNLDAIDGKRWRNNSDTRQARTGWRSSAHSCRFQTCGTYYAIDKESKALSWRGKGDKLAHLFIALRMQYVPL